MLRIFEKIEILMQKDLGEILYFYITEMEINSLTLFTKKYVCDFCKISCSRNKEWDRHINTAKHKRQLAEHNNEFSLIEEKKEYICLCGKKYNTNSGLWKHKHNCNPNDNLVLEVNENNIKTSIEVSYLSNLMLEVVKNNNELQKQNQEFQQELQKQNQDFQMQMMEICKTSNNVNINNNSHNKTFNLQVFLNEECKDAMNLSEFIESIHLKLPDLLNIGKMGYTEGISKIILKELNETAQNKRPVHCSDIKRETMYVKQENKWEKEGPENLTIKNAIKNIEQKNIALLMNDWKAEHPDHMKSESSENDEYLRLVNQITSGNEDNLNKVVRRIAKDVMINKKNI
jgi:hypothetical protein